MKVINLFAGPGAGKSTTAAGLFHKMKLSTGNNIMSRVELVLEYAKDLTYEKRMDTLDNQVYVFAKQFQRMYRLKNQVDWIVTDSPLLLSLMYKPEEYPESFSTMVMDFWTKYDNYVYYIQRDKPYMNYGRNQTAEEARNIDLKCLDFLNLNNIPYTPIVGNMDAPDNIMKTLIETKSHVPKRTKNYG